MRANALKHEMLDYSGQTKPRNKRQNQGDYANYFHNSTSLQSRQ